MSIIALNVDEDLSLVEPFLKRSQLNFPVTLARDFAYEYFPTMALPSNWITGAAGTHMFESGANKREEWLNDAAAAIENALGLQH